MNQEAPWLTCVGSRDTPAAYCTVMTKLGKALAERGGRIRSGNARGADQAWEKGAWAAGGIVESYTVKPKRGVDCIPLSKLPDEKVDEARAIAARLYSRWSKADQYIRDLMTRNVFQVLGRDLGTPSAALLCWAEEPRFKGLQVVNVAGGTGLAVRVAAENHIPVLNLHLSSHLDAARRWFRNEHETIADLVTQLQQGIPVGFDD